MGSGGCTWVFDALAVRPLIMHATGREAGGNGGRGVDGEGGRGERGWPPKVELSEIGWATATLL